MTSEFQIVPGVLWPKIKIDPSSSTLKFNFY